jgi:copper chaperone CopZ
MDRRSFLYGVTASAAAAHTGTQSVKYAIKGFTCITCAVGLEVMLRGLKGIASVHASYPENQVIIGFDAHVIAEDKIKEFIQVCGFSIRERADQA